jgi:hypothetical protein
VNHLQIRVTKLIRSSRSSLPGGRRLGRALAAAALAAAVATTALGTVTANGDTQRANQAGTRGLVCPGLPPGVALTGNTPHRVWRVTRSGSRPIARVRRGAITKAVRGRDGTIWVEARRVGRPNGTWRWLRRLDADRSRRVSETGDVRLSHIGTLRGRTTVVTYIDRDELIDPDIERFGHVYVEFSTGVRRSVTFAEEIVNVVKSAAPGLHRVRDGSLQGVVAVGRVVDAPDDFTFHDFRGRVVRGLFDPNDDAPFFGPPSFSQPVLSPHGAKLSWTEGPDWSHEQNRLVGNWTLVVADSKTGAESVRVRVGRLGERLHHADYDGRYWVGTFSKQMDRAPKPSELRIRVVDTRAMTPRPVRAGCSTGFIASIDRFVND